MNKFSINPLIMVLAVVCLIVTTLAFILGVVTGSIPAVAFSMVVCLVVFSKPRVGPILMSKINYGNAYQRGIGSVALLGNLVANASAGTATAVTTDNAIAGMITSLIMALVQALVSKYISKRKS